VWGKTEAQGETREKFETDPTKTDEHKGKDRKGRDPTVDLLSLSRSEEK